MENMVINYLDNFYSNKKVFVTGCTGFKGSWICLFLKLLGAKVTGYALKAPETDSLFTILNLEQEINYIEGDINDFVSLQNAINTDSFDIVLHLAAQSLVRESYLDPKNTFLTNAMGTVNLLEAVINCSSVKAVLNVTTDKCYANQESVWPYREIDPLGGFDPYSASKACSEIITSSYQKSFFSNKKIGLASARAGNVIGGGDFSKDRIIPDIVRAIIQKNTLYLRNPLSVRPWQHVLDVISGYLILTKELFFAAQSYSEPYNFAPIEMQEICVKDVVDKFVENLDEFSCKVEINKEIFHETKILKLDPTKSVSQLKWKPKYNFLDSIKHTAFWYKAWLNHENLKDLTERQVISYVTQ